jgi:hypothetical protein
MCTRDTNVKFILCLKSVSQVGQISLLFVIQQSTVVHIQGNIVNMSHISKVYVQCILIFHIVQVYTLCGVTWQN